MWVSALPIKDVGAIVTMCIATSAQLTNTGDDAEDNPSRELGTGCGLEDMSRIKGEFNALIRDLSATNRPW